MRRVSSRQRLVSWDAFDAAAAESSDEEGQDFITCYEASLSRNSSFALEEPSTLLVESVMHERELSTLRRKRERPSTSSSISMKKAVSFSDLVPVVISAHAWEVEDASPLLDTLIEKPLPLDTLMDDVQLDILSFLSASDARNMALVSKHYRRLLCSKEAMTLWTAWFQRRWPSHIFHSSMEFVDKLKLPTALVHSRDSRHHSPNMSVLLGMAARHCPTAIDETLLAPPPLVRLRHTPTSPKRTMFRTLPHEGHTAVQYFGPVGTGDRCIRANQPLPGPERIGLWSSFANKVSYIIVNLMECK